MIYHTMGSTNGAVFLHPITIYIVYSCLDHVLLKRIADEKVRMMINP
jgi:hypothetical protein